MANYKITVLEIGRKTVGGDFYFGDFVPADQPFPNPFSMTLLQGDGKNILIDTGINVADPAKMGAVNGAGLGNAHGPDEVLGTVGLSCADIDAVIITHLHFDHAGAIDCYPKAHFYIQKDELEGWRAAGAKPKYAGLHIFTVDLGDIERLEKLEQAGRATLLDGDAEIVPGVRVVKMDIGHTYALQTVLIDTEKGTFLHTSDACNRPENLTGTETFPFYLPNTKFGVGSPEDMMRGYDKILGLVDGDLGKLIMTHDDERRQKFPNHDSALGLTIFEIA